MSLEVTIKTYPVLYKIVPGYPDTCQISIIREKEDRYFVKVKNGRNLGYITELISVEQRMRDPDVETSAIKLADELYLENQQKFKFR